MILVHPDSAFSTWWGEDADEGDEEAKFLLPFGVKSMDQWHGVDSHRGKSSQSLKEWIKADAETKEAEKPDGKEEAISLKWVLNQK